MTFRYLDLADLLIIAEAVLEMPAEKLAYSCRLALAESAAHAPAASYDGVDFYPDLPTKAAVLCIHLAKNHPFPDGNKRVAFLSMIELMERSGYRWTPPPGDEDGEISAQIILDVAAGPVTDHVIAGLAHWIRERVGIRG
ncbi:type II toxin-antitoxin system death-on-curing family toxin [Actinoallomurus purpureus]|uniref:type II toxin-antitoxin system death-on-curing family toxin n=1 Tax=Actinoallomurus purpureus TaxID=478114 RepID=UPI0020926FD1|nr:type II toxin-antitoxin system death-on-curing family toxin [Actinoallomurus purpureus]MCO6006323.1 type II toxin-antitoxin system death-on-curing family toxin [Actinoallomurus purpureus]